MGHATKSKIPLEAENTILRPQLIVLQRKRVAFASPIAIGYSLSLVFREC